MRGVVGVRPVTFQVFPSTRETDNFRIVYYLTTMGTDLPLAKSPLDSSSDRISDGNMLAIELDVALAPTGKLSSDTNLQLLNGMAHSANDPISSSKVFFLFNSYAQPNSYFNAN